MHADHNVDLIPLRHWVKYANHGYGPALYAPRLVPQLMKQRIYFDCGTGDGDIEDNRALDRRLTELGVPHTFREFSGLHGWGYWKIHLRDALLACTAGMK